MWTYLRHLSVTTSLQPPLSRGLAPYSMIVIVDYVCGCDIGRLSAKEKQEKWNEQTYIGKKYDKPLLISPLLHLSAD